MTERIKAFKAILGDVDPSSLEQAADDFKRDMHPERDAPRGVCGSPRLRGEHFTLVPWRALLEHHRGREVVGGVRGMGVSRQFDIQRDRGVSH